MDKATVYNVPWVPAQVSCICYSVRQRENSKTWTVYQPVYKNVTKNKSTPRETEGCSFRVY